MVITLEHLNTINIKYNLHKNNLALTLFSDMKLDMPNEVALTDQRKRMSDKVMSDRSILYDSN